MRPMPAQTQKRGVESLLEEVEPESSRLLLLAALESFAQKGFHATTTRDVAQGAGLSPAAVYVHYAAKSDLLYELTRIGHESVLREVEAAIAATDDPAERLSQFVSAFATWHARHHTLARVVQYEMAALPSDRRDEIVALRRRFDRTLDRLLRSGVQAGEFAVDDLPGTRRAILSLCIDIARWYGPNERRGPEGIGRFYADLVLRMLDG